MEKWMNYGCKWNNGNAKRFTDCKWGLEQSCGVYSGNGSENGVRMRV